MFTLNKSLTAQIRENILKLFQKGLGLIHKKKKNLGKYLNITNNNICIFAIKVHPQNNLNTPKV